MRFIRTLITFGAAALLAGGCASGGASGASNQSVGTRYVVSQQELASNSDRTLYELLERLHPLFLRTRDVSSAAQPVDVYVDGGRTEGIDALRRISVSQVKDVRFYEPAEANLRFGNGHNGGLIAVTMR
jgi:hypothetical protein